MSISRSIAFSAALAVGAAAVLAACGGGSSGTASQGTRTNPGYLPQTLALAPQALQTPALLSINFNNGSLEYWPIKPKGGNMPVVIAKSVAHAGSMAADGNEVMIANGSNVVIYDVSTNAKRTLANPFGSAYDVAIRKDHTIFTFDSNSPKNGSFTMYPGGSGPAREITCNLVGLFGGIAVDNEGNLFYDGDLSNQGIGIVEIPNPQNSPSPNACRALNLNPEPNVSGFVIDPKTDSLVTLTAPDQCAGGNEAEMTIYPKPYSRQTAVVREMNANCSGGMRLNSNSTIVFYGDQDVSGSFTFIREATFPGGKDFGIYGGGAPGGMTTIPNTLPN